MCPMVDAWVPWSSGDDLSMILWLFVLNSEPV